MPIQSTQLGPGTLTLGSGPLDVSLQVTACKITPSEQVTSTDAIKVLGGGQIDGTESVDFTCVMEGTFLTDLLDNGVVAWSYANAGLEAAYVFTPNDAAGATLSGTIKSVVPLQVGGDEVEAGPMTAPFTWRLTDLPTPVWVDSTP